VGVQTASVGEHALHDADGVVVAVLVQAVVLGVMAAVAAVALPHLHKHVRVFEEASLGQQ